MTKEALYFEINRIKLAKLQSALEKKGLTLEQCLDVAETLEQLAEPVALKPAPTELIPFYARIGTKRTSFLVDAETAELLAKLRETKPDEFSLFLRQLEETRKSPNVAFSKKARILAKQAVSDLAA